MRPPRPGLLRAALLLPALLAACGEKAPPPAPEPPPAPAIVPLSVTPVSAWDSLMVEAAAAIAGGTSTATARAVRDRLMKFPEEPGKGDPNSGHDAFPGPSRAVRLYVLGELAARIGDDRGLRSAMDSLMSPVLIGGNLPRKPSSYALGLQALILEAEGQHERAMERLDSLIARVPPEQLPILWVGATLERPRRMAWLRARKDTLRADSLRATITAYPADELVRKP